MTEPTIVAVPPADEAPAAVAAPAVPAPAKSRAWIGVLLGFVALALVVGMNVALFTRVQDAQDRADEAVTLAGGQDVIEAQLAELDASVASLAASGDASADDLDTLQSQVGALRKCVNTALDAFAQATQAGKPVSISKC